MLRIRIITPAPRGSRYGNRTTSLRWARLLRGLGHRVDVATEYRDRQSCDLLIALHARRSADSIARFKERHPDLPLVLCLTGTDVYQDIQTDHPAQRSMEVADLLVTLQPMAALEVPEHLRSKIRPIIQSATQTPGPGPSPTAATFDIAVVGHLRPVKDPFRTAMAARLLPASSRIRVLHIGGDMSESMAERARKEMARNPRYRWLGELPRWETRRRMKRSQLLVLTSKLEGGANVVSEALADGIPVISSHIAGSIGLLGADYPGYFPAGDTRALARLLLRAEQDETYRTTLKEWCEALTPTVLASAEEQHWQEVLEELLGQQAAATGAYR
jgi:putative glycosyltransferase (TIGR04348 family)